MPHIPTPILHLLLVLHCESRKHVHSPATHTPSEQSASELQKPLFICLFTFSRDGESPLMRYIESAKRKTMAITIPMTSLKRSYISIYYSTSFYQLPPNPVLKAAVAAHFCQSSLSGFAFGHSILKPFVLSTLTSPSFILYTTFTSKVFAFQQKLS